MTYNRKSRALPGPVRPVILVMSVFFINASACSAQDTGRALPQSDQQLLSAFLRKSAAELVDEYLHDPPYPLFSIRRIIEIGDPAIIPALERAFARADRQPARQFLAAALVSLGDTHPGYFEYLASRAAVAAKSDLPFPVRLGLESNTTLLPLKSEFLSWVRKHGGDVQVALQQAAFDLPATVEALGEAADPRSRSILLRGLKSPNVLVVFEAALGLARLQDDTCIPRIVAAAKRMAGEERSMIAKTLLYFESSVAQQETERLIDDPVRLQRWRVEVNRRGWKAAMRDNGH